MNADEWSALITRVMAEAAAPDPRDRVALFAPEPVGSALEAALRPRVRAVVRVTTVADVPPDTSIVCLHSSLRLLPPAEQRALLSALGRRLPERALAVIGDAMWSLPVDDLDAPEQYGAPLVHVQPIATLERWLRDAGFLPDTHRYSPGVAVIVAVRA